MQKIRRAVCLYGIMSLLFGVGFRFGGTVVSTLILYCVCFYWVVSVFEIFITSNPIQYIWPIHTVPVQVKKVSQQLGLCCLYQSLLKSTEYWPITVHSCEFDFEIRSKLHSFTHTYTPPTQGPSISTSTNNIAPQVSTNGRKQIPIMKEMDTKEKVKLFASAIFALGMSIYSFNTTVTSYNLLSANTDDFTAVVKNWKALPLIDFKYVGPNEKCPNGFEEGKTMPSAADDYELDRFADTLQTRTVWPGAHGWCECGPGRSYTYKVRLILFYFILFYFMLPTFPFPPPPPHKHTHS